MNYMKQVADMLGLDMGEVFKTEGSSIEYKITENGLLCKCGKSWEICSEYSNDTLDDILTGRTKIARDPFVPKTDQQYFYVNELAEVKSSRWCSRDTFDLVMNRLGNCYRKAAQAEAEREKWYQFFHSSKQIKWEFVSEK